MDVNDDGEVNVEEKFHEENHEFHEDFREENHEFHEENHEFHEENHVEEKFHAEIVFGINFRQI